MFFVNLGFVLAKLRLVIHTVIVSVLFAVYNVAMHKV
jgi:hypothetical protein